MGKHTCYMNGVRIRTERGDVAVEAITLGEEVVVLRDGQEILERVKWIGRGKVDLSRHARTDDSAPICIRPGAIADNQPIRALYLSPEHCLIIDGLCVPAKFLVNGGTITSERDHAPFTYYHIELERHGILIAENTPAESYLDTGNRSLFDNSGEPRQLHPSFTVNAGAGRWLTDACAPLVRVSDQLEPIWRQLAERSRDLGYACPDLLMTADTNLHILADGKIINPTMDGAGRYVFIVPAGVSSASLVSRFAILSDVRPYGGDARRLGIKVSSITIESQGNERVIPADFPTDAPGWHEAEKAGSAIWRWTDGAAVLPLGELKGAAVVTIVGRGFDVYPVYDERGCPVEKAA
jgi:Hint domain